MGATCTRLMDKPKINLLSMHLVQNNLNVYEAWKLDNNFSLIFESTPHAKANNGCKC